MPLSQATAVPPAKPGRLTWLDLFRGVAVLAMIETHVVNTFLTPGLREAAWFSWLNWANGLVAPAFLFIAGYAQGMSWRAAAGKPAALGRKAKRLLGIVVLGYALHFPIMPLWHHRWGEAFRVGTTVDVLQCLAVSLLAALGVLGLGGRLAEKWRLGVGRAALVGLGGLVVWLAPFSAEWSVGAVPLDAYLNNRTGSLFPLFPWAAFVFGGVLAGSLDGLRMGWMLVAASGVRVGAHLLDDGRFSALSPAFFGGRLAWLLAFWALGHWIAQRWQPAAVRFAGRESLVMYAAHLMFIEWTVLAGVPRGSLGWIGVALVYALVLALTYAATWAKTIWLARPA